ncbi:MAG: type II toxin-antitoxin system RelE/ParE family toxin [Candidatus Latescibacteria bacterium]|nr:type II toxin-antitoxin system RelE/ParE family toxin [Candidatus Latescibacterota bacterium]MCK5327651.1 type II toxin-antitoxin system RelE/ParE family toxin [Candidatus Latescibacterota bacterium]MCK5734469.1 type II toxin-antitoxin system RelE/ParE family toxin [Candidatus Latescibacterota bacterium]
MSNERTFEVILSRRAERYYQKLSLNMARRIDKCLKTLEESPLLGAHIRPLHGKLKGFHRYKVGGLRVVYKVDTKALMVYIGEIQTRGDVYK